MGLPQQLVGKGVQHRVAAQQVEDGGIGQRVVQMDPEHQLQVVQAGTGEQQAGVRQLHAVEVEGPTRVRSEVEAQGVVFALAALVRGEHAAEFGQQPGQGRGQCGALRFGLEAKGFGVVQVQAELGPRTGHVRQFQANGF
ncbi:MAG: hypothetical protein IPJ10_12610 [Flavobacteriales bacterium]|nr:hypothetical protein [Flavobacteriales bacterium]